jgi:hypothetical protein
MSRGRTALWVLLLVWFGVVLFWASQPIHDVVPTGDVGGKQTSHTVTCSSPLSSSAGPDGPLPTLPSDGSAYQRKPCVGPHEQYRRLFVLDALVVLAAMVALAVLRRRTSPIGADVAAAPL